MFAIQSVFAYLMAAVWGLLAIFMGPTSFETFGLIGLVFVAWGSLAFQLSQSMWEISGRLNRIEAKLKQQESMADQDTITNSAMSAK